MPAPCGPTDVRSVRPHRRRTSCAARRDRTGRPRRRAADASGDRWHRRRDAGSDRRLADARRSRARRRRVLVGLGRVRGRDRRTGRPSPAPSPTGDDTDTTACIAGGLAGAYWGFDGLPREWQAPDARPGAGRRGHGPAARAPRLADVEQPPVAARSGRPVGVPALADATGGLGMTFLPGKRSDGWTGPWWRDLDEDGDALRTVHGVDALLLLVEDQELADVRRPRHRRAPAARPRRRGHPLPGPRRGRPGRPGRLPIDADGRARTGRGRPRRSPSPAAAGSGGPGRRSPVCW